MTLYNSRKGTQPAHMDTHLDQSKLTHHARINQVSTRSMKVSVEMNQPPLPSLAPSHPSAASRGRSETQASSEAMHMGGLPGDPTLGEVRHAWSGLGLG
jgi:hypothetical protein